MVLFGVLMLLASISMIRNKKVAEDAEECRDCVRFSKLVVYGIASDW
jgi:uncharacterized protein